MVLITHCSLSSSRTDLRTLSAPTFVDAAEEQASKIKFATIATTRKEKSPTVAPGKETRKKSPTITAAPQKTASKVRKEQPTTATETKQLAKASKSVKPTKPPKADKTCSKKTSKIPPTTKPNGNSYISDSGKKDVVDLVRQQRERKSQMQIQSSSSGSDSEFSSELSQSSGCSMDKDFRI